MAQSRSASYEHFSEAWRVCFIIIVFCLLKFFVYVCITDLRNLHIYVFPLSFNR